MNDDRIVRALEGAVPLLHKVWSGNHTDDKPQESKFNRLRKTKSFDIAYGEKRFAQVKTGLSIAPVFLKVYKQVAVLLDVYLIVIAGTSSGVRSLDDYEEKPGYASFACFPRIE